MFGLTFATAEADYIVFQQHTSKSHQDHIILHELGHILAGHTGLASGPGVTAELYRGMNLDALRDQYSDLEPETLRRALQRSAYDTSEEREAETVATIILEWASVLDCVADPPSDQSAVRKIETALGDRLGWL
ncbi:hypothetical protein NGB36_09070 [Streptomyces sp. RB6PN25]|uniref:IrrE N-terminal-like domain-containing protein n=1 Tax=Streptomyces humicola TaxID=2953240 RepID=A0ABT1PSU1_9ACTN|nr:hypothetical protein [Streptomyces humicola]MCQ4080749.1 hypothetical protein [Streptomyces humicola]